MGVQVLTVELTVEAGAGGLAAGGVHGPLGQGQTLRGTVTCQISCSLRSGQGGAEWGKSSVGEGGGGRYAADSEV